MNLILLAAVGSVSPLLPPPPLLRVMGHVRLCIDSFDKWAEIWKLLAHTSALRSYSLLRNISGGSLNLDKFYGETLNLMKLNCV